MPVAFIENASRAEQRVLVSTVDAMQRDAAAHQVKAPTLMIIGNVARAPPSCSGSGSARSRAPRVPEKDDSKVSREQAERAADALIESALRNQQGDAERNTAQLLQMFPALSKVPPMERHAALAQARESAKGEVAPRVLLAVVGLSLAAAAALALNGHVRAAIGACAAAIAVGIARQAAELLLARRHLRDRFGE